MNTPRGAGRLVWQTNRQGSQPGQIAQLLKTPWEGGGGCQGSTMPVRDLILELSAILGIYIGHKYALVNV